MIYSKDGYFEAKLQLRPYNKEVLDFAKKQINKSNSLIAKEIKLKQGVDLYISSRKFAVILAKKLKKVFGGETKVSKTLFGINRLTSKKVYRVTVCFRQKL